MKRITALLLAIILAVVTLASCGDGKDGKKKEQEESTKSATESVTDSATIPEEDFSYIEEYIDELKEDRNYDGKTFTVIGVAGEAFPETEEITGALENDALYDRSRALETAFGIDMEFVACDGLEAEYEGTPGYEITDLVKQDQDAGLCTYDLIQGNIQTCGRLLVSGGYLHTLNDLEPIDLDKSWWNDSLREQFCLDGNLYYLSGKPCLSHYVSSSAILFSKKIVEDYNIENLYDIVKANEWTVDKMLEVAQTIPGGGAVSRYGVGGGTSDGLALYFGAGFTITENDPTTGNPSIPSSLSADALSLIDKLTAEFTANKTKEDAKFAKDEILFEIATTGTVADMREEDVEFGVLPMPKYSSEQEEYYSYESSWYYFGIYIPAKVSDEEFSATIAEATGAYSEKYIEPQFYEKMLKSQSVYDLDSKDMLDIIYNSSTTDLVDIYQWGSNPTLANLINEACNGVSSETVVSSYASTQRTVNLEIKQLLKQVQRANKSK